MSPGKVITTYSLAEKQFWFLRKNKMLLWHVSRLDFQVLWQAALDSGNSRLLSVIGSSISRPFFSSNKTSLTSFSRPYKNFFTKLPLKKSLWLSQWTLSRPVDADLSTVYSRANYYLHKWNKKVQTILPFNSLSLHSCCFIYFEGGGHYI